MTTPTFTTRAAAVAAGYRTPDRKTDRDISGRNLFGYRFQAPDGQTTVTVRLTEETNSAGQIGCYTPMFPPAAERYPSQEAG
jgi:hypothetical protein